MKLAVSNIAWPATADVDMYRLLTRQGVTGLEIAPTRVFPDAPYSHICDARQWSQRLFETTGLTVCSMQSVWFGRTERLFGPDPERALLSEYTKEAILFAEAVGCKNIVIGAPRNRRIPDPRLVNVAVAFFAELAVFAAQHVVTLAIEPNPVIYGTNFLTTTEQALNFVEDVGSTSLKVNLDLGTMLANSEDPSIVTHRMSLVNHIHVSEPQLVPIRPHDLHHMLRDLDYENWFSIEMQDTGDPVAVVEAVKYVRGCLS